MWWLFVVVIVALVLLLNELAQRLIVPQAWAWLFDLNPKKTFPTLEFSPTWKTDKVAKIIHQTAPADEAKWHPVWVDCQKTWKEKFPDFEYKMWTDEDMDEFILTKYEWFWPTYKAYDHKIKRIDAARYFIMYEYGGIYADMDYECIENFMEEIPDGKVSISQDKFTGSWWCGASHLNALMASPPKHPFWNYTISNLELYKYGRNPLWVTGPHIVEEARMDCPESMFNSLNYNEYTNGAKWAKHHCTTTWVPAGRREIQQAIYFAM
jgi:mannosyltransferase OCH1-like enzyme